MLRKYKSKSLSQRQSTYSVMHSCAPPPSTNSMGQHTLLCPSESRLRNAATDKLEFCNAGKWTASVLTVVGVKCLKMRSGLPSCTKDVLLRSPAPSTLQTPNTRETLLSLKFRWPQVKLECMFACKNDVQLFKTELRLKYIIFVPISEE